MASVDGSTSVQGASDELYDVICGPCQTDNLYKQAHHYCNECREYLCNSCKDVHRKLAMSKNHTILPAKQIPAPTSGSQRLGSAPYCSCNKNQHVEFVCEDHKEVVCNPCKMVKHRNCKTVDIQEKKAGYTTAQVNSILAKITALIHEFDTMQKQRKSDRKELKRLTEECKKKIKGFRLSIDAILDNLEKNVMDEVDKYDEEQSRQIDQHITVLTTGLQMLDTGKEQFEDAKTNGNKVKMFTTDVQVSRSLKEYEAMLAEMENDISELTLTFEGNKKLADFPSEITSLGSLKTTGRSQGSSHKGGNKSNKKAVLGKQATLQNQVRVRLSDDNDNPWISGCTFMPSGHAVLCDGENEMVKLLDKALLLREHLKLCFPPWDVSVVDDNNVIITLPYTKQLQYIQVFPQLKTGRTIKLDKECRGIEVFGDEIYTAQFDGSRQREVHILDLNGNRKRKLQTNVKFDYPYYITVSRSGKIFVSDGDCDTATVTCMSTDGNLVYQYKDEELGTPRGMYVDAEDNILVCDSDSNTVQMITANGKRYDTLLSSNDGIDCPYSIAYRETDDTLLVGGWYQDHVSSYKLV